MAVDSNRFWDFDTNLDGTLQKEETGRDSALFQIALRKQRRDSLTVLFNEAVTKIDDIAGSNGIIADSDGNGSEVDALYNYLGFYEFVSKNRIRHDYIDYDVSIHKNRIIGELGKIFQELNEKYESALNLDELKDAIREKGLRKELANKIVSAFQESAVRANVISSSYAGKTVADIFTNQNAYPLIRISKKENELYGRFREIAYIDGSGRIDTRDKFLWLLQNYANGSSSVNVGPDSLFWQQTGQGFSRSSYSDSSQRLTALPLNYVKSQNFKFNPAGGFYQFYNINYFRKF